VLLFLRKEIPVSKSNQNQEPQSGAKENTMSKSISGPLAQPPQLPQSQQQVANVKAQQPSQHQPYSASLVNSGFGFGFDLHGGEMDNQLTFIVNVQSNGDAARKGLKDGNLSQIFFLNNNFLISNLVQMSSSINGRFLYCMFNV
jgi:hypothetical protein